MSAYPKAVADGWHPIATLAELKRRPLARMLMDKPLVVFRTANGPAVLLDRCPHRNMALSLGAVRDGAIECPYHGWRFDGAGRCTLTPGADAPARHEASALPVQVAAGLIWTTLAASPRAAPALPHPLEETKFDTFLWPVRPSRARLLDAIENLLDPAHPHFLHAGIVRSRQVRKPVDATVRVRADFAEAIYVENTRPAALMPRMLEGLRGRSIGRFFPPTIGQVAFEGANRLRLAITVFFTPETQDRVRPFAHFATPAGAAPAFIKEGLLRAFHIPVLAQDRAALRRQAESIAAYGPARYALGPLDLLFPAIQALMHGEAVQDSERCVRLHL
ncbi:MAG TPA: aromatic ring-hydroxylating dioxygenase subunit alpha [Vitreimonas sp.]|uniref:aromatic ring-hydroxylating dioxygenase subunit alpha n=1 Tax=Vitreimonas sp. TaxID=3069702 RepID=UPI002D6AC63F|nr:aromatic ring-hydroxylating dioxygenase subunit alpha [Vitreimonas sp.]HYD88083.1 aromatic ring-hydroxylating dioxygenase subunit alpha [Vitreimonas sp.]